jgi:3-phenylpropionate/trans-cinnamate dioxygenase ferredoxin reductase subunit
MSRMRRTNARKAYLLGVADDDKLAMRPESFYADKRIELLTRKRAVAINRAHRKLVLKDDTVIEYEHLVLATGASNRSLRVPGTDLDGVFFLRTLDEASALRVRLRKTKRAVAAPVSSGWSSQRPPSNAVSR